MSRPRRRGGAAVGALAALVVAGAWLAPRAEPAAVWTAETSVVVLPAEEIDRWAAASAAEALGTGQVAATAAEVLRSPRIAADAARVQGLDGARGSPVTVAVDDLPGTAVLRVRASAPARAVAEAAAAALPGAAAAYLRTVRWPYRLVTVSPAGPAGVPERPAPTVLTVLAVAGLAGLAAQQAWRRFPARRRARDPAARGEDG